MERRREPLMPAPLLAGYEKAKERTEMEILSLQGATRDLQLHIAKGKEEKGISVLTARRDESTLRLARYEQAQEGEAPEQMEMEILSLPGWAAPTWAGTVTPP